MISALILARIHFAVTITFHIIFPAINIGLSLLIFIWEAMYLRTGDKRYYHMVRFWSKIFAMLFGMGVVTGTMMSFMFGLSFGRFSYIVGNVLGPLLSFEVLTAFFLEASFLGVMLFGWNKVGKKFHLFATGMVFFGTCLSAFWIIAANSFMQTPAGHEFANGMIYARDWVSIIFSPSMPYRLSHMLCGSFVSASLITLGISCWFLMKKKDIDVAKLCAKFSGIFLFITITLQIFLGDLHGLNTKDHQPVKLSAIEGHWEDEGESAPLVLFGIPNMQEERNDYEVKIPKLGSIILTHSMNGKITTLKSIPKDERPYVPIVFFSFRIMFGCGVVIFALATYSLYIIRKKKLETAKFFHKFALWSSPLGVIAVISGWYVTECGRQPWLIQGLIKSHEGVTMNLNPYAVIFAIGIMSLIYIVISFFLCKYIKSTLNKGMFHVN